MRKRYLLKEHVTGKKVDRALDWDSAFLPYQKIDMSLMCRELQPRRSRSSCPRCLFYYLV
jgi:hypothetical protein